MELTDDIIDMTYKFAWTFLKRGGRRDIDHNRLAKAKLLQTGRHRIHRGVVLAWVFLIRLDGADVPNLDCKILTLAHTNTFHLRGLWGGFPVHFCAGWPVFPFGQPFRPPPDRRTPANLGV